MATTLEPPHTVGDLHERFAHLGDIPLHRIRLQPWPGEATENDLLALADGEPKSLCELIDGVLVEKAMGSNEGTFGGYLHQLLSAFVRPRNLGVVGMADTPYQLAPGRVRVPDISFTAWDRFPGRRRPRGQGIWPVVPNLVVEVFSSSNTPREMHDKRVDYFAAGVELVWEVDPDCRTVAIYTRVDAADAVLTTADTLDAGRVLPGFAVTLADLFGELDRDG
jgi:Uma2 family endonuclease